MTTADDRDAALQRLFAEELPTGRFGDRPPARRPPPAPDPNAAAHVAELLAALATPRPGREARHLRAVPNPPAAPSAA